MKKIIICLCFVFFTASFPINTFAQRHNPDLTPSFIYRSWGDSGARMAVRAPAAYIFQRSITTSDWGLDITITPVEITSFGDNLYIVCNTTNAVYILDNDYNLINIIDHIEGLEEPTLRAPEGVFVTDYDSIYIADTFNNRILLVDSNGNLIHEFLDPGIMMLGERVTFLPSKVAVDHADRIFVVGRQINRGIIELSPNGEFRAFVGAPQVRMEFTEVIRRFFMTDEQLARMSRFVPTEYNNITVDSVGFVFGTIGTVDPQEIMRARTMPSGDTPERAKPVKRLSPAGNDIMQRRGNVPIIGSLDMYMSGTHSFIVDVDVRPDGIFSILDQRNSRVFTYDMYGNLLFIFGNQGTQLGSFHSPSSLTFKDDYIIVTDQVLGSISIFEPTAYGSMLLLAVNLDYNGRFTEASELWNSLLLLNSNLQLAYSGIGRMHYRNGDLELAIEYFRTAWDFHNYNLAKELLRKEIIARYFPLFFGSVVLLIGFLVTKGVIAKLRRIKEEETGDYV